MNCTAHPRDNDPRYAMIEFEMNDRVYERWPGGFRVATLWGSRTWCPTRVLLKEFHYLKVENIDVCEDVLGTVSDILMWIH